jgi:hypothetical protein
MRNFVMVVMIMGLLLIPGCTPSKSLESKQDDKTGRQCNEPENPYSEGTGHYAGYEWAESRGLGVCNGSSQSFNEGCEEYETQESEYEECEARKKK